MYAASPRPDHILWPAPEGRDSLVISGTQDTRTHIARRATSGNDIIEKVLRFF